MTDQNFAEEKRVSLGEKGNEVVVKSDCPERIEGVKRRRVSDESCKATSTGNASTISTTSALQVSGEHVGPAVESAATVVNDSRSHLVKKRLINVLPKEVLIDLLYRSADMHPQLSSALDEKLEECANARRLMVRNVSFATENQEFFAVFSQYGPVEDFTIVRDKETRRSKGFGFVTYKSLASVKAILSQVVSLDGRELQIKFACGDLPDMGDGPTSHLAPSSHTRVSSRQTEEKPRRKLFVRNLSPSTTTDSLRAAFSDFGEVEDAVSVVDHITGKKKGYGFVTFANASDAAKAASESQRLIDGQLTFVAFASAGHGGASRKGPLNANANVMTNQAHHQMPPMYSYIMQAPHNQPYAMSNNQMYFPPLGPAGTPRKLPVNDVEIQNVFVEGQPAIGVGPGNSARSYTPADAYGSNSMNPQNLYGS